MSLLKTRKFFEFFNRRRKRQTFDFWKQKAEASRKRNILEMKAESFHESNLKKSNPLLIIY